MVNSIKDLFKDITFILMFTVWIILIVASIFSAPQRVSGGEGGYELLPVAIYTHVIIITGLLVLYVFDEPHKLYILAIACLGLVIHPLTSRKMMVEVSDSALVYVTYCSCIIINSVIVISHGLGEFVPKRTLIIFSMVLGVLFIAAGSIVIEDWRALTMRLTLIPPKTPMDTMIASGVMAIFNGLVHFVDVGLTIKFTE